MTLTLEKKYQELIRCFEHIFQRLQSGYEHCETCGVNGYGRESNCTCGRTEDLQFMEDLLSAEKGVAPRDMAEEAL